MKELFKEFNAVNEADWLAKITADLKGKPIEVLASKPEPDLDIVAYHHQESYLSKIENKVSRNLTKPTNDWAIRQVFSGNNASNKSILTALNEGVTAVGIVLDKNQTTYEELTKDVGFEFVKSDITFNDKGLALNTTVAPSSHLNYDVLAINAKSGFTVAEMEDYFSFYKKHETNKTIWVSGDLYGASGASTVQELAMTLAHLNEYIQFLVDKGESLQTINTKICISLSVNDNYFVNISKFRALQNLIPLVFKGYDSNFITSPVTVYAKTNMRHLAQRDMNNNPLRQTTQAMAAVIGGCDVLTVAYGEFGSKQAIDRFRRIAKNIQLVLKEEAYLDKVIDPAGGSYYIESLTAQIIEKSWALFLQLEEYGGLIQSLENGIIQQKIDENKAVLIADLNSGKRTYLGVNKFPNALDKEIVVKNDDAPKAGTTFPPLLPFLLENHFVKTPANHE